MNYRVALCQFRPILLNVKANLDKMEELVSNTKADLIVFPELCTSGYVFNSLEEVKSVAEHYTLGGTAQRFKELAKLMKCSFVIGFPELDNASLYNSSMLINPDGNINLYRKIHLFNEEKRWFQEGNLGFNVFETKNRVKVGMMICFDWMFPESARTLMLKGAQLIAHPSNLVLPWCQQAMITRSLENRVFSATCNRIGTEVNGDKEFYFTGASQLLSPLGETILKASTDKEEVLVHDINISLSDNKQVNDWNNITMDRKTNYYLI